MDVLTAYKPQIIPLALIAIAVSLAGISLHKLLYGSKQKSKPVPAHKLEPYVAPIIPPVGSKFKWDEELPIPYRPFAGKKDHKVNMGIRNISKEPETWLLIENTYKESTKLRKEICNNYPKHTIHVNPSERAIGAAREYYEKVTNFLLDRYPQYFYIKDDQIYNAINDVYLPLDGSKEEPSSLLLHLAASVEEDVVILLKDNPNDAEEEYKMRASINGFPAGFDPAEGFDQPISIIHGPVPSYENRLKLGMSRFFNRLEPKDMWYRTNWSIQAHKNLFSLHGNHARAGQVITPLKMEEIDFEDGCFLRVERQVLTRMPKSRAVIMTIRTYTTPMAQVKAEGYADELIKGIDGLPDDLAFYKKRAYWGEAVKEYLRT